MDKEMNQSEGLCANFWKKHNRNWICRSIVILAFFLNPFYSNASHIVGGEMSYTCLGNFTFEVKLTVYRDCFYGAPNAVFDPVASIGIFNANNELVMSLNGVDSGQLLIPATIDDTLNILLSDPCMFAPNDVCVQSMTYMDTVILPPISGGYQLVYQRCCRNSTISNIISSFDTGASFVIDISETALLECNSSPTFSAMPPLFLCVNEPFVFDQSVIDIDGDSLVYKLCTPLDGASFDDPRPQPPNPPPYENILWQNPPYGLNNLLGGAPLTLDPVTGMMSAVPNTQGLFLVGMCIEEYRNGELISETRREFQYNVGFCETLEASFETPDPQCEDLEVTFENTSIHGDEFLWIFNDPTNLNATSTAVNPTYTFSDTGNYTVMLVANPNDICSDTTYADISLVENSLEIGFTYVMLDCTDSVQLALIDTSVDTTNVITAWLWELSDGQTSTEQFPIFILDAAQDLTVTLTVTSENDCQAQTQDVIPLTLIPSNLLPTEITICEGDTIQLNPDAPLGLPFTYTWQPADGLSANDIASPLAFPDESVSYKLTILDTITNCVAEIEVNIEVLENPNLTIHMITENCNEEVLLVATSDVSQGNFIWATDILFNNIVSFSDSLLVSNFSAATYYVQFLSTTTCKMIDSIELVEQSIDVEVINSIITCVGETAVFYATNNDPDDIIFYTWFDSLGNVLSTDSIFQVVRFQPSQNVFYFQAENQFGCTYLDSVLLSVISDEVPLEYEIIQLCEGNEVTFINQSPNFAYYQWIIELANGNDTLIGTNINYEFPNAGTYNVTLQPVAGLPCELPSDTFEVTVGGSLVTAEFDWEYLECENDLIIQFNDISTAIQGNIVSWSWTFGNHPTVTEQNPILELDMSQTIDVEMIVTTDEGCADTLLQTIEFATLDVGNFETEVVICDGASIVLNPLGNTDLTYEWSPANFLNNPNIASPIASPPVSTLFTVLISDSNNPSCVVEKTVFVTVPDEPVEAAFEYEIIDCTPNMVTFNFIDNSTPALNINNWFWAFSDGQTSNEQSPTLTFEAGISLGIQFQVQTVDGCTDILLDTIEVETFEFNLPQNEIVKCTGVPVNLNPGGNPNYTYEWEPSATLNNPNSPNPIANPIQTTEYCVTVTNGDCTDEACVTVVVPDVPLQADFDFNVSGCIDEATINFQDASQYSLGNIIEWNWTFSDGTISDLENPVLTVSQNTTIEATLEVVTADGCESSISQTVEINLIETEIPSQVVLCDGNPMQLNVGGNPNHTYSWSPSSGLTDDDVPSPVAFPLSTTTYTVIVSDGDCQIVQTVEVVVPSIPLVAEFSYSIDDCTDNAILSFEDESEYAPGGVVAWNWQFSNGDSSDISNPSLSLDQSQMLQVTLEVTTNDGCVATTSQNIEINLIDINVPDTIVNCGLAGVNLNPGGDPTYDYEWSPSNGLSNPNTANPLANPTSSTIYTVTVSDGPCEISRSVEVIVPDEPLEPGFTFNFDDCTDNAIIQFTDTTSFSNNSITNWDWTMTGNNTFTSDLQNPVIILNQSDTLLVELTVTTADGCTATVSEEVEVNLVDINISGSVIYCNSGGIILNPNGNPDYEYTWSPSTGLSATDVASPLVTGLTQTTNYSVTVTYGNCTLTRGVEILVPDTPLEAGFELNYLTCIDSVTLEFVDTSAFSGSIVEWEWLVNSEISDEQNPIFTFYQSQSINVQLVVTTAHGCTDTLLTGFDISVGSLNIPSDVASCNGNGVFLNPDSNPNFDYHWSPADGLFGDTLSANPFAMPDTSIIYTVTVSNPFTGCVEERTVAFNVPTQPLTAGFEWDVQTCADSAVVTFLDSTSYSGILQNWEWTMDNGFSSNDQNPDFTFQNADTLNVQLIVTSNDNCIDSIETEVIIDIIEIDFLKDTIQLCDADSVYLNPNGNPNLFYTWSPPATLDSANIFNPLATPTATTEYSVTITSPNNVTCNEVRKVNVLIPTQPIDMVWNYPTDTTICTTSIDLLAQSVNATEFLWSDQIDFQNVLSDSAELIALPNNAATYYLQVSDDAGCTLMDSIEVTSYAIQASLAPELTLCYGDSVELEVVLSPLTPSVDLQYTWTPQDGIILNNNTSTPLLSPEDSTPYTLLIENQFGCEYADTIQVNVLDMAMLIEVTAERDSINADDEVQLMATENPNWSYHWSNCETLNDCQISNPIATLDKTNTYAVKIQDDTHGCIYEDSISIFVFDNSRCREPFVFVPKGFTPNDDGLNDFLYVRGNYIEEMHFVIYNRWGEKVFETQDMSEGWDGKVDGKTVPPAVFGYYLEVKCFGGEEYLMKGDVTLIR